MEAAGLGDILGQAPPLKMCKIVAATRHESADLLDEAVQRKMISSIGKSASTYISGLRCWAAFCDASSYECHFPATEDRVLRYCCMFASSATLNTYLKHLRWAHRFLRLNCDWDTDVVSQTRRGAQKSGAPPKPKLALQAADVKKLIARAINVGDHEQAAILAVARHS